MKKAKIMLASLAILSVVGGALAFKAKNYTGTLYCSTTSANACATPLYKITIAPNPGASLYCAGTTTACTQQTAKSFVTFSN